MRSWLYRKSHARRRVSFPSAPLALPCLALPCPTLPCFPLHSSFSARCRAGPPTCNFNPSALLSLSSTTHGDTLSARPHHPCSSQHTEVILPSACPSSCTFPSQRAVLPSPRAFVHVAREEIFFLCACRPPWRAQVTRARCRAP